MVRFPRAVDRKVTVQDNRVVIFVLKPTRYTRCSTSHISQAIKPLNSSGPILATAENRDTVAIEPLSKYWNGSRCVGSAPSSSDLIAFATYLAPWIAPCATPGTPSTAAISPTTNTFGYPGTDRSGSTLTRPARSSSAGDCSAMSRPNRLACTPADQTLQADSMRRRVP